MLSDGDLVLVPTDRLDKASEVLHAAGHQVRPRIPGETRWGARASAHNHTLSLSVTCLHSATVIRSGTVVLTITALPQRLAPGSSSGSLAQQGELPNERRQSSGSSSVGRASAFQVKRS